MGLRGEDRFLSDGLWPEVRKLCTSEAPVMGAIAYYSEDKLSLKKGDLLVVDASDRTIQSGATCGALLLSLVERGVDVRSEASLHAKVLAVGGYAVVGSANASHRSEKKLTEAAMLTSRSDVVAQVMTFIEGVARTAKVIDQREAKRLAGLEVTRTPEPDTEPVRISQTESRRWWVATGPVSERIEQREAEHVERGKQEAIDAVGYTGWESDIIRYPARAPIAAKLKLNDRIIQVYSDPYGDEESAKVYCPASIVHVQEGKGWVRFHLKSLLGTWEAVSLDEARGAAASYGAKAPGVRSTVALEANAFAAIEGLFSMRA